MDKYLQRFGSLKKYIAGFGSMLIIIILIGLGIANGIQPYYEYKYSNLGREDIRALRAAIRILKVDAFFSSSIDWSVEPERTWTLANSDGNINRALSRLVAQLGDNHSRYLSVDEVRKWDTDPVLSSILIKKSTKDGIGYISLPTFAGQSQEAVEHYSLQVRSAISTLQPSVSCGWVVDLRGNFGGNMAPMLDGIAPFLSDAPYFYWKRKPGFWDFLNGSPVRVAWQGRAGSGNRVTADLPLAILQDASTSSAAELVLLSLKQRERTKSFGASSAGKPTGNQAIPLPNGGVLAVTTSVPLTKDGRTWTSPIHPDVPMSGSSQQDDSVLIAASDWILGSCLSARISSGSQ